MTTSYPKQDIRFLPLAGDRLESLLGLEPPPQRSAKSAFKQLRYVEAYVRDPEIGCSTVAIEKHYIDRDYMEDHSVFFSRNLLPLPNFCTRIHFFRGNHQEVEAKLADVVARGEGKSRDEYVRLCRTFSFDYYLGFCIVKPLPGTPVGRTVLRHFPKTPKNGNADAFQRMFHATRPYRSHLLGAELTVKGIAFQQQDVGVAACATTAIWTALQKNREHEELSPTTPAHITARATHARMPFGRSMPSEGLSVDQMCQAVEAFGVSPVLSRVSTFDGARDELYSALRSGQAPVLIINQGPGKHHAVAVVGMKVLPTPTSMDAPATRASEHLGALYIHDDRLGPYLLAKLIPSDSGLSLKIRTRKASPDSRDATEWIDGYEEWQVTQILLPTHAKIRLSFHDLQLISVDVLAPLAAAWEEIVGEPLARRLLTEVFTSRAFTYIERMVLGDGDFDPSIAPSIQRQIVLARYLGVVRIKLDGVGSLDLLVDTTSTYRNPSYLAWVCSRTTDDRFKRLAAGFGVQFRCPVIASP